MGEGDTVKRGERRRGTHQSSLRFDERPSRAIHLVVETASVAIERN